MLMSINYFGYGTEFDSRSLFLISNFDFGKNVIIYGVDNSSSTHADNKKEYILIFSEVPSQEIDDTTITAVTKYYSGSSSFFYVNVVKIKKSKAKVSEIQPCPLCLGNIAKRFYS